MVVWIFWLCSSDPEVIEQLFYFIHLFQLLLVRSMVLFSCEQGTIVLRKETVHSNSGLLWGSSAINIGEPSHDNPFLTLRMRSETFAMKIFAFDLHLCFY